MDVQADRHYLGETLEVTVPGGVVIEALVAYGDTTDPSRMLLVFPPNPLLGGDSQNNVVQALLEEAVARDMLAVTFNYRGTRGETVGGLDMMSYWEGLHASGNFDEILSDAAAVVERVRDGFGACGSPALAGYSFGSLMALQFASRFETGPLACVSPPLAEYDFEPWLRQHHASLFVASEDAFCTGEAAAAVARATGADIQTVKSDDHFFRGAESTVAALVCNALGQ